MISGDHNRFSFFTFASGRKYLDMAFALARSYRYHNGMMITFCIVSTSDFKLPADLIWVDKRIVKRSAVGPGLEFKLRLHDLAPTERSIFIDADSLIYGKVGHLFDVFGSDGPNVIGLKVTDGIWVDEDVRAVCEEFELDYLIRYCGAFYYVVKNERTTQIFDHAMSLYHSGRPFQRNASTMYDEPVLGIALSSHRIEPIRDDGNIWGDLAQLDYDQEINVFSGMPTFSNLKENRNYKFWLPTGQYRPAILHVGSGNHNKKPWLFDSLRLKLHYQFHLPVNIASFLVRAFVIFGYHLARKLLRK